MLCCLYLSKSKAIKAIYRYIPRIARKLSFEYAEVEQWSIHSKLTAAVRCGGESTALRGLMKQIRAQMVEIRRCSDQRAKITSQTS